MAENGDKAKRFNIGRMGLAYVVVIGTMLLAAVLLFSVADKKIDPAVVWVSVSGFTGVALGYYFGAQTTGDDNQ